MEGVKDFIKMEALTWFCTIESFNKELSCKNVQRQRHSKECDCVPSAQEVLYAGLMESF